MYVYIWQMILLFFFLQFAFTTAAWKIYNAQSMNWQVLISNLHVRCCKRDSGVRYFIFISRTWIELIIIQFIRRPLNMIQKLSSHSFDMCKPKDTNQNVPITYDTPELYINIMTIMWLISLLGRTTLSNLHLDIQSIFP